MKTKRIFSALLAALMLVTVIPQTELSTYAAEQTEELATTSEADNSNEVTSDVVETAVEDTTVENGLDNENLSDAEEIWASEEVSSNEPTESLSETETITTSEEVELTEVKFTGFTATSHYGFMELVASYNLPSDLTITYKGFEIGNEGASPVQDYGSSENKYIKANYSYMEADIPGTTIKARPYLVDSERNFIYGEWKEFTISAYDELSTNFSIEANVASISISYDLKTNDSSVDLQKDELDSNNYQIHVEYKTKSESEYKTNLTSKHIYSTSGNIDFGAGALKENTEYDINVYLSCSDYTGGRRIGELKQTIKTKEDKIYSDSDFPDSTFRARVKQVVGWYSGKNELRASALEKIPEVDFSLKPADMNSLNAKSAIKSIEGIQYLVNIKSINLDNHLISDISPIMELKNLDTINFRGNELRDLPDLSQLTGLNHINLENNKLDSKQYGKQRQDESIKMFGPKFISNGDKTRIFFQIEDVRVSTNENSSDWDLTVTIDGTTTINKFTQYYGFIYVSDEISLAEGNHSISIEAKESYNRNSVSYEGDFEVVNKLGAFEKEKTFLRENTTSVQLSYYLPHAENNEIKSIKLVDGQSTYTASGNYIQELYEELYIDATGTVQGLNITNYTNNLYDVGNCSFSMDGAPISAGNYDLIVETNNGEYRLKNVLTTDVKPLITLAYHAHDFLNYANSKDVYLRLVGTNLNYEKFRPILKKDGVQISEFLYGVGDIYRLSIDDSWDRTSNMEVDLEFEGEEIPDIAYGQKTITLYGRELEGDDRISSSAVLNAKTNEVIVGGAYTFPKNTNVDFKLYSTYSIYNIEDSPVVAKASIKMNPGKNTVSFKDDAGKSYKIGDDLNTYCWSATYTLKITEDVNGVLVTKEKEIEEVGELKVAYDDSQLCLLVAILML